MLVGKYVFVIFLSLFVERNFRGTCSSIAKLKGYIGKVSLGTPDLCGSGSGRIFALPLTQKKECFHRFRFHIPAGEALSLSKPNLRVYELNGVA